MHVVYFSQTGKIAQFVAKTQYTKTFRVIDGNEVFGDKYIFIVGTTGFGEIALPIKRFLKNNSHLLVAVIGSGNKNWGDMYCKAAYKVAQRFDVPLLFTFESSGNTHDIQRFCDAIVRLTLPDLRS